MAKNTIGTVTHYFGKPKVGIIALSKRLATGDTVQFIGHGADFKQTVKSMQIDHVAVKTASAGKEVGIRVKRRVREGTKVYKVSPVTKGWFNRLKALFD